MSLVLVLQFSASVTADRLPCKVAVFAFPFFDFKEAFEVAIFSGPRVVAPPPPRPSGADVVNCWLHATRIFRMSFRWVSG